MSRIGIRAAAYSEAMKARWLVALALIGISGASPSLGAQRRVTGDGRAGRPVGSHPGPHLPPPVHGPFRPTVVPPFTTAPRHRPMPFQSSLLGLVVLDPYWWSSPDPDAELFVPPPLARPGERLTGGLQLDVEPRSALVYVDGVLTGTVDQFSGYYQHLQTDAGWHLIELIAVDYEPLTITISVAPDRTTTYRGALTRASGR